MRTRHAAFTAAAIALTAGAAHAQLAVTSTSPARNASNQPGATPITITFDRAVNPATVSSASVRAFGKLTGVIRGTLTTPTPQTVLLTPDRPLHAGEVVTVSLSHNLRGADNTPLRPGGYTFQFTTGTRPNQQRVFRQRAVLSNRAANNAQTRIYGGLACDLNGDGALDLTTINEVSADLRVMLNRNDGSGLFAPMLPSFTPIPTESSPNEVADFNGDGFIDVVTSSDGTDQIAVCLGNGDGTFRTPTVIAVGDNPRGFGVFDIDGDGDDDITVANANSNTVSILFNDGAGHFSAPVNMPVAGGPYGMTAADMNEDGLLDLVVGCRTDQTLKVLRGNGDGTFTQVSSRPMGGQNWVVVCADLNLDGHMDVSAANSFSANGSILLGNGDGTMQPVTVYATGGHTASTDLCDLDGDGYPDWVLSAFGAGTWYAYLNDRTGHFTPFVQFPAPRNPSCCVPMDLDNDGDIDLVLTDEIADLLVVMANVCPGDFNANNTVSVQDIFDFLAAYFANNLTADINHSGAVSVQDIFDFLTAYFSPC